jgi:hypothetical protein
LFCGHELRESELALIRRVTREFANLTLTELAATICELLEWRRPSGGLKSRECYLFLRELHRREWLPWLPAPQPRHRRAQPAAVEEAAPTADLLRGPLRQYQPLQLQLIEDPAGRRLFRRYLEQHHYLGYCARMGATEPLGAPGATLTWTPASATTLTWLQADQARPRTLKSTLPAKKEPEIRFPRSWNPTAPSSRSAFDFIQTARVKVRSTGRRDVGDCRMTQPDFVAQIQRNNLSFRIPTPFHSQPAAKP